MNFLALCKRARRKCRATGTGPTSVLDQNEEYSRLIDMVNEAWMFIQELRPDWKWMRQSMSFPTVQGQAYYTLAQIQATGTNFSNFGNWQLQTFRNYVTATGTNSEICMDWLPYDNWRDVYQFGANRNTLSQPTVFTETPDLGIGLGPTPIAGYTITGDYFKVATEMAANDDTPLLPSQFHMAIVYKAMQLWGVSESVPEIYDDGVQQFNQMLERMELQQLPRIQMAGALA